MINKVIKEKGDEAFKKQPIITLKISFCIMHRTCCKKVVSKFETINSKLLIAAETVEKGSGRERSVSKLEL